MVGKSPPRRKGRPPGRPIPVSSRETGRDLSYLRTAARDLQREPPGGGGALSEEKTLTRPPGTLSRRERVRIRVDAQVTGEEKLEVKAAPFSPATDPAAMARFRVPILLGRISFSVTDLVSGL